MLNVEKFNRSGDRTEIPFKNPLHALRRKSLFKIFYYKLLLKTHYTLCTGDQGLRFGIANLKIFLFPDRKFNTQM
jgi:hypothetical protein